MGLFSRKEPASGTGRRSSSRSSLSSEAQANELRGRARRRLIGALVLVLAAVIIVPMLFDSPPPEEGQVATPVVVPAIVPPETSGGVALAPTAPDNSAAGTLTPEAPVQPTSPAPEATPPAAEPPAPVARPTPAPERPAAPEPAPKKHEPEPKPKPKASTERTDDGSVAIALLEGRSASKPKPAPAPAQKGSFVLQVAAYTSDKDAEVRRERLVSAGVTNAYVENAVSGGKTTYRLRVGPFPTRDAAQAAQARLRALGYDNGFISSK
ncbi:MAG: SPOR domain-containing protein [Burkholderiaceae bacterium]